MVVPTELHISDVINHKVDYIFTLMVKFNRSDQTEPVCLWPIDFFLHLFETMHIGVYINDFPCVQNVILITEMTEVCGLAAHFGDLQENV